MDGKRIQKFWSQEMQTILSKYREFETLIPSREDRKGSSHAPEDGRFVETLLKEALEKYLPKDLEVLTGFILKPAVKTNNNDRERKGEDDDHSSQLDIIVYDSASFPIYLRFGDTCVVPPEGVIAIISVKKHLRKENVENECIALAEASSLCKTTNGKKKKRRRPYLVLVSMSSDINNPKKVFDKVKSAYENKSKTFDFEDLIGMICVLESWTMFKRKPDSDKKARYVGFDHLDEHLHLGLQFLLTGILSVFYDETRRSTGRPGFTAFPKGIFKSNVGDIEYLKG